jgi:hypothetical protein
MPTTFIIQEIAIATNGYANPDNTVDRSMLIATDGYISRSTTIDNNEPYGQHSIAGGGVALRPQTKKKEIKTKQEKKPIRKVEMFNDDKEVDELVTIAKVFLHLTK